MFCFEIITMAADLLFWVSVRTMLIGNQSFAKPSFELFLIFLKFCPSVYGHEIKRSAMNKRTWSHLNLKLVEAHTYLLTTYNKIGVTVYSTIVPQLVQRFKNEKEKKLQSFIFLQPLQQIFLWRKIIFLRWWWRYTNDLHEIKLQVY